MISLIKNLKNLKEIEPNIDWTIRTRNFLLAQIQTEEKISFSEKIHLYFLRAERKLIPSPVKIMASLLVLCLLGGTTLAAKASMPGTALYPIKTQIVEKTELLLATTPKAEAEVHLKHANNRVAEVKKLAATPFSDKNNQMNAVINNFKKDISAAQSSLDIAENEDGNVNAVVAVAVQINQGAVQASQVLNQTISNDVSEEVKQSASEAVETAENVQDNTTNMIVNKKESGQVSDQTVTNDQVKEIVVNNINTIENKIKLVEEKVNQIESAKVSEAITQKEEKVVGDLQNDEVKSIIDKKDIAKQVLDEARKMIGTSSLSEALAKAQESKEITKETEKVLVRIDKIIKDQQDLAATKNQSETNSGEVNLPPVVFPPNYSTTTPSSTALQTNTIVELGGSDVDDTGNSSTSSQDSPVDRTPLMIQIEINKE